MKTPSHHKRTSKKADVTSPSQPTLSILKDAGEPGFSAIQRISKQTVSTAGLMTAW